MDFPIYEVAAFGAAVCWAMTALIASYPAGHLGALAFNRMRQVSITLLLGCYVLASGRWQGLSPHDATLLIVSGLAGIFVGDTLLFNSLNRVGPRRSSILFALNAPITALLGWLLLGETLPAAAVAGVALTFAGVILAIFFGKRPGQTHSLEAVTGSLLAGVMFGLGAASGQALGSIIARPVMAAGFDPFVASMLRVGVAACCLSLLMALPFEAVKPRNPPTWQVAGLTVLTGVLAMGIGMTLMLFALSGGKAGIVATLSATSPVLILPMLWLRTGERPAAGAWAGAGLAVAGMALLFLGR